MKTTTQLVSQAISEMYQNMVQDLLEEARIADVLPDRKFRVRFGTIWTAKKWASIEFMPLEGLMYKDVSEFSFKINRKLHLHAQSSGQAMADRISINALHEVGHLLEVIRYHAQGQNAPQTGDLHGHDWKQALADLGYKDFDKRTFKDGYTTYEHSPGYSPRRWYMHYNKSAWVKKYAEKYDAAT